MREHHILYIIVAGASHFVYNCCGMRIWGSDFYFLRSSYTVQGPLERFKIVDKSTKNKIDIYAVRVIILWKNKAKKSLFCHQIVWNQKEGSLVFKMFNFWIFLTFYFQFFIFFSFLDILRSTFLHFEIFRSTIFKICMNRCRSIELLAVACELLARAC